MWSVIFMDMEHVDPQSVPLLERTAKETEITHIDSTRKRSALQTDANMRGRKGYCEELLRVLDRGEVVRRQG